MAVIPAKYTQGKIHVIPARELDADLVHAWSRTLDDCRHLAGPFFRPEFTQAVAQVRSDVQVCVSESENGPCAFFPFQRSASGRGCPVGGRMSDFQALIARPEHAFSPLVLLQACGLKSYGFHHLLADDGWAQEFCAVTQPSPYIDLSQGFAAYHKQQRQAGSQIIGESQRKLRKLEREKGPLRFEPDCDLAQVVDTLVRWKREQYQRTGDPDVFSYPWVRNLLAALADFNSDEFRVQGTALFLQDKPLAISLNLKSKDVLHGWFTSFDRNYCKFSPGIGLIIKMAEHAEQMGLARLHMGRGGEVYKRSLMTGAVSVAEGAIDSLGISNWLRKSWLRGKYQLKQSSFRKIAEVPWRWIRPLRDRYVYR